MSAPASAPRSGRRLRVTVLSPELLLLDKETDFVALPAHEGELGVLPRHAPLVAKLGSGEMRLKDGNAVERHFVSGGYVQVRSRRMLYCGTAGCGAQMEKPAGGGPSTCPKCRGAWTEKLEDQVWVLTELAVDGTSLEAAEIERELAAARALPATTIDDGRARRAAIERALTKKKIRERARGGPVAQPTGH